MHPWVNKDIEIPEEYRDRMLDVKTYPNINDLFYFTDLLITDYSSNIYEYSLMRRPMLFFAFDEIQYSFSRGFHRPYRESAPGKVVTTFEDLMVAIENKDFEFEKVEEYVKYQFDHFDSKACDRVIDWLLLNRMPAEITEAIEKREAEMKEMMSLKFKKNKPPVDSDTDEENVEDEVDEDSEELGDSDTEADGGEDGEMDDFEAAEAA